MENIAGFIIDLDGTIFRGETLIPGADKAVSFLESKGKRITFLSNRGNMSRKACFKKLLSFGIHIKEEQILLSSTIAAWFIKKNYPSCHVWLLGDQGLHDEMKANGVNIASSPEQADFLIITLHETLTYEDLNMAFVAVQNGARILATNADKSFPGVHGHAIDVAGMIGAIEGATGKKPELVFGKPSHHMVQAALNNLNVSPEHCLIIGDSLESDIAMGKINQFKTMLVLSGNTSQKQVGILSSKQRPDYIVNSIADIISLFK